MFITIYDCYKNIYKSYVALITIGDYTWIGMNQSF